MEVQARDPTARGPAEWFTGDVWIDAIAKAHGPSPMGIAFVHFAPGARTAWHSHSIGQTLYVTEGEGRVRSRGGPLLTIRPGDVIHTPGGEWHWHGAEPDRLMTHLSMAEGDAEWGEHISDRDYLGRE